VPQYHHVHDRSKRDRNLHHFIWSRTFRLSLKRTGRDKKKGHFQQKRKEGRTCNCREPEMERERAKESKRETHLLRSRRQRVALFLHEVPRLGPASLCVSRRLYTLCFIYVSLSPISLSLSLSPSLLSLSFSRLLFEAPRLASLERMQAPAAHRHADDHHGRRGLWAQREGYPSLLLRRC
jgi:hypothetical protein